MKKLIIIIIIIIFIFWINLSFGQSFYEAGEIFYRDGTSKKGYLKVKNSEIKFKIRNTDKKPIKLNYKRVKSIVINEDGEDYEYQYKIIKGKTKGIVKLLKVVISDASSLYKLEHETSLGNNLTAPISLTYNYKGANFYIGKDDSSIVEYVGANSIAVGRKSIRKGLMSYFENCKKLVKKLKKKEFKNKDIVEVVKYYNKECSKDE